jgi:hypothetical protein
LIGRSRGLYTPGIPIFDLDFGDFGE